MNSQDNARASQKVEPAAATTDDDSMKTSETEPFRDPAHWKTGDEPMTASQKSYLSTLATEAGEAEEPVESLTKAEASVRIDELREKTGRG